MEVEDVLGTGDEGYIFLRNGSGCSRCMSIFIYHIYLSSYL